MTVVAVLVLAAVLGGCAQQPTTAPNDDAVRDSLAEPSGEPPSESSGDSTSSLSASSCVEEYTLETLPHRRFAFDGTVTAIEQGEYEADAAAARTSVTYDVHEWYAGGDGATVTLSSWDFIVDGSSGDPPLEVGKRLLVSGDTDMAWGCGFTRAYSAAEAEQWRDAFER